MLILNHIDRNVKDYFSSWIDFNLPEVIKYENTAGLIEPVMVRQHFLFYSSADMLCFCHFHQNLLKNPGHNIFTAIGLNPCINFLLQLKSQFPKAKIVNVFDNDLLGKVMDCKVVLAYLGQQASFKLLKGQLSFSYKGNEFTVPASFFSLHRFRMLTGIRSNHRTLKPKGAISFFQLISQQYLYDS